MNQDGSFENRKENPGRFLTLGVLGAAACWTLLILTQGYRFNSVYISTAAGALICGLLWSAHAVTRNDWREGSRIIGGGLFAGAIGGALGGWLGNWVFNGVHHLFVDRQAAWAQSGGLLGLPLGWGLMGMLIGMSSAWGPGASGKTARCALFGLLGGMTGGALFNLLRQDWGVAALLAGLLCIGAAVGLGWGMPPRASGPTHLQLIERVRATFVVGALGLSTLIMTVPNELLASAADPPRGVIRQIDVSGYPEVRIDVALPSHGAPLTSNDGEMAATERWVILENGVRRVPVRIERHESRKALSLYYHSKTGHHFVNKIHLSMHQGQVPSMSTRSYARPNSSMFDTPAPRWTNPPGWAYPIPLIILVVLIQLSLVARRRDVARLLLPLP